MSTLVRRVLLHTVLLHERAHAVCPSFLRHHNFSILITAYSHLCSIPGLRPSSFTPSAYEDLSTLVDRASFILSLSSCRLNILMPHLSLLHCNTLDHPRPIPPSIISPHRIHIPACHDTIPIRFIISTFVALRWTCTSSRLHTTPLLYFVHTCTCCLYVACTTYNSCIMIIFIEYDFALFN
jgi:hypothetical protein